MEILITSVAICLAGAGAGEFVRGYLQRALATPLRANSTKETT
jgi:hypothetical protein